MAKNEDFEQRLKTAMDRSNDPVGADTALAYERLPPDTGTEERARDERTYNLLTELRLTALDMTERLEAEKAEIETKIASEARTIAMAEAAIEVYASSDGVTVPPTAQLEPPKNG